MFRSFCTLLSFSFIYASLGCGSATPSQSTAQPPNPSPVERVLVPEDSVGMLARLNREAREGAVDETMFGVVVHDPFRRLETDDTFTRRWVAEQNARTTAAISVEESALARIDELLSIGSIGDLALGGQRLFYSKREGEQEQPIVYVREGENERALLDPSSMGERAAIDWYYPSPDGALLAYGLSHNGDERSTLHILDVTTGETQADEIARTKWTTVSWLPNGDGFYFTRYPNQDEPDFDAENEDGYFPRVFFHEVGTNASADVLVYGAANGPDFPSPHVSSDGRWLTINVFRGWTESDVYIFDRGRSRRGRSPRIAPDEDHALRTVVEGGTFMSTGLVHRGNVYLMTNKDAPRYRVVSAPVAHPGESRWRDVIAEQEATLQEWAFTRSGIVTHYIDDVRSRVYRHDVRGRLRGEVELPSRGAVRGIVASPEQDNAAFVFESYLMPPSLFQLGAELEALTQVEADFDFAPFEIVQEEARSQDGTRIPITLIQRRGLERNGNAPVLLYGYGGFNVSLMPRFSRNALYWLEQGGVYAVANTRGGGEFGEEWHQGGALANKPHVFEDFEAAIRAMTELNISRPERIAIQGGSNGGLLMGAMATRSPELFAAAASYVGLYDMVRYHHFPPAQLWVSEYGSAEDEAMFPVLHAYSPYHQVREGVSYPAMLIETADHDGRVHWAHTTKFVAALQSASGSDQPIYFFMEHSQGHGAGTRRSDQATKYARMFAFLEAQLGME